MDSRSACHPEPKPVCRRKHIAEDPLSSGVPLSALADHLSAEGRVQHAVTAAHSSCKAAQPGQACCAQSAWRGQHGWLVDRPLQPNMLGLSSTFQGELTWGVSFHT